MLDVTAMDARSNAENISVANLATGTVLRRKVLAEKVFGEGLVAMPDGSLIQLSWKNRTAYRWDSSLGSKGTFAFTGEGWGLCYDAAGRRFVQSDGTATLTFRNTATFARLGGIVVRRGGRKVDQINELECDSHSVLANVWHSAEILRISLSDGHVTEAIDASPLGGSDRDPEDVLNGIARLPNGHWLLTGKRWPLLYEVTFELR